MQHPRRNVERGSLRLQAFLQSRWRMAAVFVVAAVSLQVAVGAFQAERGLYSDESAHFMNGLLIRDYVREGLGENPLSFAREYYRAYPKIAPLMWPPLLHAVLGLVLLPGWPPMPAAILLLGMCAAWTAWRLYRVTLAFSSSPVALGVAGLFLLTPTVVSLSSSVMIDIVIAALAMEAAWWLSRYFEEGRLRDAALFGIVAAFACLAKGNGIAVVLAPLFLTLITWRFDVLGRSGLYVAAAIVIALAVPFLAVAYQLDARLGDFGPVTPALMRERLVFYSAHIWLQLGALPVALAVVGAIGAIRRPSWLDRGAQLQISTLLAMTLGAFAFHLFSPHLLSHERYITLALAPILGLAAHGVMVVCRPVKAPFVRWSAQLSLFGLMAATHFMAQPLPTAQRPLGYRAVAAFLDGQSLAGKRVLVVSNEQGEGAAVVEVAVLNRHPRPMVIRGSKLLATDDWMGWNLRLRYATAEALLADLEAMHVDFVVFDASAESRRVAFSAQVEQMFSRFPDRVSMVFATAVDPRTGPLRPLSVYRILHPTQAPAAMVPLELPPLASGSLQ